MEPIYSLVKSLVKAKVLSRPSKKIRPVLILNCRLNINHHIDYKMVDVSSDGRFMKTSFQPTVPFELIAISNEYFLNTLLSVVL